MTSGITIKTAHTDQDFEFVKELFVEYANSLDIDLSFQNFSKELETVRDQYDLPTGSALLIYHDGKLAGCAGIRRLKGDTAELKRMYVRPDFRGLKLGKELLRVALASAKDLGYLHIRLDTLASMESARRLYESFGFETIPAYYVNPIEGAIYMEKNF